MDAPLDRLRLRDAMEALAEGDRGAFEPVFRVLQPILQRYCVHLLGEADGADAAQDALLKLFSQATGYRRGTSVEAWAITIARYECQTRLQKRRRHREVGPPAEQGQENDVERRLLQEAAVATLQDLSESDRKTILEALDDSTPAGATHRKRKQRAFERLRAAWRQKHGT
ncbi:MAG: sigma factor [Myxococcota bacterium]